jgi:carbon-monoxide dehydrogenase medium subunit
MKPAPFAYHAPETLDEALALLASGDGARVLAGGQSLVPMMKARVLKPSTVIDVNRVPGLAFVEEQGGALRIGALTRQQALLDDGAAGRAQPLLHAAGRFAGYLATRHRGTVGGSLAFAAPWAELTAAVVALDAQLEIRSTRGERTVAARSFFHGPHETALEPDEILTAVQVPAAAPRTGAGFHEVSARYRDFAQVAAAATVTVDEAGVCTAAELVLLRVAPAPHRVDVSRLVGAPLDGAVLDAVADLLTDIEPLDDIEVSGAYRRRVATTLARRALSDAFDDAGRAAA